MKTKYYVNYQTGVDFEEANTLGEAMALADAGSAYTQRSIIIEDEEGRVVAMRRWYGVAYNEEDDWEDNPIVFGDFGYYADWVIL